MKIGLTGSIACGKSTVSQYLRQKGCFIVDADAISSALTADDGRGAAEIRRAFGDDVFSRRARSTAQSSASSSLPTRRSAKRSTPFSTR